MNKHTDAHSECEVAINLLRTNAHGQPALVCSTCRDKRGQLVWIDWLSKKQYGYLKFVLGVEEIKDDHMEVYGNTNAYTG